MSRRVRGPLLFLLAAIALAPPVRAQTSYPMVTRVQPAAIQRGQSAEVTISGAQNFAGASAILFEGTGVSGAVIEATATPAPEKGRRRRNPNGVVRAKITVAPDASLGPREFRVVTPQGVSSIGLFVVTDDPVIVEADDKANDEPAGAQPITLPAAITGAIGKLEDVDWYAVHAEAGQLLTFAVWGNRLEDKIHDLQKHLDPILVLFDDQGRELAADDNHNFADPVLAYTFPRAGTYRLQIRDTTYAGDPSWSYVLHATAGPYATAVFPLAVRPGEPAEIRAWGSNVDPAQPLRLDVSADVAPGTALLPLKAAHGATPPVPFVVTDLPRDIEHGDAPEEPVRGQSIALPVALSGCLAEPNDGDAFLFEAKKGRAYTFEVESRRVGSAADPVLRLLDVKGKIEREVDDTFGKDPRLDWTAPADGLYCVALGDLHSRGGTEFGYVLLAHEARPDFTLTCDPDKINIGPGARTAIFIKVDRRNGFNGQVTLSWDGLPAGITATPLVLTPNVTQGVIVLTAAADAPHGGAIVKLKGRAEPPEGAIERFATPQQEIYLPGGGRGLYEVATLAAAVTDPSDITLEAQPSAVTLKPGETAAIDVTVTRREGFTGPVNLALDLAHLGRIYASALPPGVRFKEAGSKTLLDPKTTRGKILIEARPDAPACDKVPIAVMGHVSINFVVKTAYSTAPIVVTVAPK